MNNLAKMSSFAFVFLLTILIGTVQAHPATSHKTHPNRPLTKKALLAINGENFSALTIEGDDDGITLKTRIKNKLFGLNDGFNLKEDYCKQALQLGLSKVNAKDATLNDYRVAVFNFSEAMLSDNPKIKLIVLNQIQETVAKLQELDPDNFNLNIYYDNIPDSRAIQTSSGFKTTVNDKDYYLQPYVVTVDENGKVDTANYLYDDEKIRIKNVTDDNKIHAHSIKLDVPNGPQRTLFIDSDDFKHVQIKGQKNHQHSDIGALSKTPESPTLKSGSKDGGSSTVSEDYPPKDKDGGMGHAKATTHIHSPCARVEEEEEEIKSKTFASNQLVTVEDSEHFLNGQELKLIVAPPDCARVSTTNGGEMKSKRNASTLQGTSIKIVGFTMLQLINGIWVTTPTEYVAYYPG